MPVLVEEGDRRKEPAAGQGLGPYERVGESQFKVDVIEVDSEPIEARGQTARRIGPRADCEAGQLGLGTVQGRGPHNAAGMQRDRDRGPVSIPVLVDATQRDDDPTRGGIGQAPEPALHFAPM